MAPSKQNLYLLILREYIRLPLIRIIILSFCGLALMPGRLDAQVKIMPMGNSITQGHAIAQDFGTYNSYRRELWHMLINNGYDVDFVGSMQTNLDRINWREVPPPNPDFDLDHEGHSGWRADQLRNSSYGWVNTYKPDVVLLHAGTNDILQNQSIPSTIEDISQIIDQIRSAKQDVTILLAQLIPSNRDARVAAQLAALNQAIPRLASNKTTTLSPIYVVDQATGFNPGTDTYDGLHPNEAGEKKMADKWFATLKGILPPPTALPVKLVSFSAKFEQSSKWVRLEWVTAGEKNNDYFTVERSRDQVKFEPVNNVQGAFTTQIEQIYTTFDQHPMAGTSYYRLKQTDIDGKFSYSKVVSAKNFQNSFVVYPNPAHGREITILLNQRSPGIIISIYNALGRTVSFKQDGSEDNTDIKIHLRETLEKGIYFIKVQTDAGDFIQKLVVLEN
jgi:hypothetical protein